MPNYSKLLIILSSLHFPILDFNSLFPFETNEHKNRTFYTETRNFNYKLILSSYDFIRR